MSKQIALAGIVFLSAACVLVVRWPNPPDFAEGISQAPPPSPPEKATAPVLQFPHDKKISPAESVEELNAALRSGRSNHYDYETDAVALLLRWAEIDPEAALRYALKPLEDDGVSGVFLAGADEVIAGLARRSPTAARRFLERSVSHPATIRQLAPVVMREYAYREPAAALAWVTSEISSDSDELRPALALQLVKTFDDNARRPEIQAWLTRPEIATNAFIRDSISEFTNRLASENPHLALRFAMALPTGSMSRGIAWQETFRQWTSKDPGAAYRYLSNMIRTVEAAPRPVVNEGERQLAVDNSIELDYAIAGYSLALAKNDHKAAAQAIGSIQDPSLREAVLRDLTDKR